MSKGNTQHLDLDLLSQDFGNWYQDPDRLVQGRMSSDLYPYRALFSPIQVNHLRLKNRLVMAPMGNINMCDENGRPSPEMVAYFAERAKGGVGLLTSGLIPVSQGQDPSVLEKGDLTYFPRLLGSRTFFSGWRDIANACHAQGAHFFIQLTAGLGRVGNPECLMVHKRLPVSASWNPNYYLPSIPSARLSDRKLKQIVKNMGQAAADAQVMGLDGVYLHAHEGYLMEQMANSAFNRRKLGRYADPRRFGLEIVEEIRRRVGPKYPIMFRIDLSLALNATYGDRMQNNKILKKFQNERTVEETLAYMKDLVQAGVDLFDVDLGCYDNWWLPHPPTFMPPAPFVEVAATAKKYFADQGIKSQQGLEVPIVAVGKLGNPDLAEATLQGGKADMIMLGRPLLADPYWPQKAYAGQVTEIRPCIGCQDACINEFVEGGRPYCTVNPRCSFETIYPLHPEPAREPKRVGVVGAGPAGLEAALTLLDRGHDVTLYDAADKPGGVLRTVALAPNKLDLLNLLTWYEHRLDKALANPHLRYLPGTIASVSLLEDERYDAILCATGAKARRLPVPGGDLAITGLELAQNPSLAQGKKNIVIVGAGSVGVELAFLLADNPDCKVTIVEATPYVMKGVCTANRTYLIHYLEKKPAQILLCSQVKEITDQEVKIRRNVSKTVPDPWVTWTPILPDNVVNPLAKTLEEEFKEESLPADLVVFAVGNERRTSLYDSLVANYCAPEIHKLGDAFQPATIKQAIRSGYRLALSI